MPKSETPIYVYLLRDSRGRFYGPRHMGWGEYKAADIYRTQREAEIIIQLMPDTHHAWEPKVVEYQLVEEA